jgi:hypothetical protein
MQRTTPNLRTLSLLLLITLFGTAVSKAQAPDNRCQALSKMDFSNIADAPTQISDAQLANNLQEYFGKSPLSPELAKVVGSVGPTCRITGYVAPSAGFVLLLPEQWNGKLLHVGCGGWCGSTDYVPGACVMHPGYACVGTDMGHTGKGGLWSRNNLQGQIDFAYRATHVVTLAAKAILEKYYATEPSKSYFMGCSTGGFQAMVEAQRFPWDFQGIVAGAPDIDESDLALRGLWVKRHFLGDDGKPVFSDADIQLLHQAVLAKCDMDDGVKDGIVGAPYRCNFDPAELTCKGAKQADCLSPAQVEAAQKIYDRPRTSKGLPISSRAVFPGAELNWKDSFSNTWADEYFPDTAMLSVNGKPWSYKDFDFDHDYQRSGIWVLYPDTNPDLRAFRDAGGKLLSYQGDTDMTEMPGAAFDYYETVEKTMGGAKATQEFYRLFAVPGMNHCGGGAGAATFDYLGYLETWVEKGKAPDVMIGAHISDAAHGPHKLPLDASTPVTFTRPVYPYPAYGKYKGSGDSKDAANFAPVE